MKSLAIRVAVAVMWYIGLAQWANSVTDPTAAEMVVGVVAPMAWGLFVLATMACVVRWAFTRETN